MEQARFEDLPALVVLLRQEISELKAIVAEKLTTPEGYEPDVTMTPNEVAEYLGCTIQNVHDKKNKGNLPFHKVGRKVFFKKKEVDEATKVKAQKRKFFK